MTTNSYFPVTMACVNLREKPLRDGTLSLVLDYYENGIRHKRTLRIYVHPQDAKSRDSIRRNAYDEAYRIANIERNKVEKRLLHQENDIIPAFDRQASFLAYVEKLATSRNANWRSLLRHIHGFTRGKLTFGMLTEEWVERFQDYLSTKVQANTARGYMGLLYTSFYLAVRQKLMPINPGKNVKKVKAKEVDPKYLTKEQIELLLQHRDGIPDWLVRPFIFSCYTGLRISDVETLVWGEIYGNGVSEEGRLQFKLIKEQVKTQDTVQIPLTTQAVAILQELGLQSKSALDARVRVFEMLSRTTLKRNVIKWRKQAGVFFTYHSSRHTFGTSLQTAGVDIYTTSKLLGHRRIETTTRYSRVVSQIRNQAISKLDTYWE